MGPKMDTKHHPVWSLYDTLRTARFNVKCLESELRFWRAVNFWMEVLIAVSTASSIGALSFWQNPAGGVVWKTIGGIAALLAVIKPFLKIPDKISLRQELLAGYRVLAHDCTVIRAEVERRQRYDDYCAKRFDAANERLGALAGKEGDYSPTMKLKKCSQAEVNRELPLDTFFVPPFDGTAPGDGSSGTADRR
jgi:hypothetical protein